MLKKFIFCLPVIVLFNDKFDTDRFKAAVRRAFFDTLLSKLDESTQPTTTTRWNTGYFSGKREAEEYVTVHQDTKRWSSR